MSRPKIAFFEFTSCEGCQLTVVDSLQTNVQLLDVVEIVQFREAMSERGEDYAIAFIEGSCARPSDEAKLKQIRERAALVVTIGACSTLGGINAIRNGRDDGEVRSYVYGDKAEWFESYPARPISAVIPVDAFIPGCPIDRNEFLEVVKAVLLGKKPPIPDYPLCVECKLKENVCMYDKGGVCAGPVTRAGCDAICPTYGDSCEGCRGMISNPNRDSMQTVMTARGLSLDDIMARMTMFNAYQLQQMQAQAK